MCDRRFTNFDQQCTRSMESHRRPGGDCNLPQTELLSHKWGPLVGTSMSPRRNSFIIAAACATAVQDQGEGHGGGGVKREKASKNTWRRQTAQDRGNNLSCLSLISALMRSYIWCQISCATPHCRILTMPDKASHYEQVATTGSGGYDVCEQLHSTARKQSQMNRR